MYHPAKIMFYKLYFCNCLPDTKQIAAPTTATRQEKNNRQGSS